MEYSSLLTPKAIWNIRQNKPSLIAEDLEILGIPKYISYSIMLGRGVFKWLAVRRDLIKLKNLWKDELTNLYHSIANGRIKRGTKEHHKTIGRIEMLERCRAEIRLLCHSERYRAPDFDSGANEFLVRLEKENARNRD